MAKVELTNGDVVVRLTTAEKLGALRGGLRFPKSSVERVEVFEKGLRATRGIRAPGLALPGRIKAGTWRSRRHGREFVAVTKGRPAVRLHLADQPFASVLVSADDPAELAASLS